MKKPMYMMVVPTVLALMTLGATAASSKVPVLELAPGFKTDPMALTGQSGGQTPTKDCGKIAAAPNYVIKLTNDFKYLRLSVQSAGQPTLLIQEPSGRRICVSADSLSGGTIESPGYWNQGTYSLYIGDRTGSSNPYTLSITQKPQ
jgi:hypothetical protein